MFRNILKKFKLNLEILTYKIVNFVFQKSKHLSGKSKKQNKIIEIKRIRFFF
jgi:hypothetical protein